MMGDIRILFDPDVTWENYAKKSEMCRAAGYDGLLTPDEMARVTHFCEQGLEPNQALEMTMNEQQQIKQDDGPEPNALPLYTCHKHVRAARIAGFAIQDFDNNEFLVRLQFDDALFPNEKLTTFVDVDWILTRVRPDIGEGVERKAAVLAAAEKSVGGYYVMYEDGYASWSPAEAFESGYAPTAEAVLSIREQADGEEGDESGWPESTEAMAFVTVPNGHVEDASHDGIIMQRVIDMSSDDEKTRYALFTEYAGTPFSYIDMQNGPIVEAGPNGFTLENLLAVVIDRLTLFQTFEFNCQENKMAIHYARLALDELNARTRRRIARGVEGTSEP